MDLMEITVCGGPTYAVAGGECRRACAILWGFIPAG